MRSSKCNKVAVKRTLLIARVFHNWERRLAAAAQNRVVRPFRMGTRVDRGTRRRAGRIVEGRLSAWAHRTVENSEHVLCASAIDDYTLEGDRLSFPSAVTTPHAENNMVRARATFQSNSERGRRRAVVVLPQWNADAEGHVGLCRLLNRFGISAL